MKLTLVQFFRRWMASWTAPEHSRGAAVLRALIYVLMALAVGILIFADKPGDFKDEIVKLEAEGAKLKLKHHVAAGLLYGSILNLVLGSVVLFIRRWWGKKLPSNLVMPIFEGRLPNGVFWAGVVALVLLAGGLRMHLAKGSLWWDELWNVKHTMSGEFRPDKKKDGELKFREASFEKGVYYYRKPTNHPPMTVATRASLAVWRKASGAERSEFNELAVRLPSLLAALVAVAGVAVLLRSWGFGAGGLVAAFLLATHPWHVRYGVDARAYSFAVLWTILGCLWLGKLIRAGNDAWRYWLLYGLNQLMLVWSLPNGIYYAFTFGIAGLLLCLMQAAEHRKVVLARVVGVNMVAAMCFIFLFLPNALQISEWGEINDHHHLEDEIQNVATELTFGMDYDWGTGPETIGIVSYKGTIKAHPFFGRAAIGLGGLALVFGIVGLRRRAPRRSYLFLAVFAAAGLSMAVTWGLHQHFYHRYVVAYMIIPFVALVGIGAVELAKVVPLRSRQAWMPVATALLVIGSFMGFTRDQRVVLNTHSYAPFREVAEYVEREANVEDITVIGYGLGGRVFQIYYPEGKFADTLEELDAELAAAEERGGPVFVVFGYTELNLTAPGTAAGAAKVMDPTLFKEVATYPGLEPMFFFHIMRAKQEDA